MGAAKSFHNAFSMRLFAGLAVCLLAAGCGAPGLYPFSGCGPGPRATLAVQMREQLPVVRVTVNDRSADLIIDTGATTTVFNRNAAAVLGLQAMAGPGLAYTTVQGAGRASRATIDVLRLGPWTLTDLEVAVTADTPEDGVLGLDVLSRYDIDVNLPKSEVVLHKGGLCPGEAPVLAGPMLELPAARLAAHPSIAGQVQSRTPEPFLVVPVRLDGAATFAMLDTGAAAGSLVSTVFAAQAGMRGGADQAAAISVLGFGAHLRLGQHRFAELLVGRERFENPMLLVGGDPHVAFPIILGHDYFITHRVWFSFASDRIFVVPVPQQAEP
jgi:clan AA aspartic protease (TIGR02281 family)